ncbi:MAG TPA: response regulator [Clostridiales bacterium]|nr:response regulator [Clostridiales bacterium]
MIKVLMVDDERLIIQGFLHSVDWKSYGYDVIGTAESAKSALKICEKNLPDIAILDINMSGMNGLELGGKLKMLNPDIVIIILTAYNEFDFAREAVRLQFDEYLLKPEIDFEDILETMERFSPKILIKRKNQMMKTSEGVWKLLCQLNEKEYLSGQQVQNMFSELEEQRIYEQYACCYIHVSNSCIDELSLELFEAKGFDLLIDFMNYEGILFRPSSYSYAVLVESQNDTQSLLLAENIVAMFDEENIAVTVGVSKCFSEVSKFHIAFYQAKNALMRKFHINEQVLLYISKQDEKAVSTKDIKEYLIAGEKLLLMGDFNRFYTLTGQLLDSMSITQVSRGLLTSALIQALLLMTKKIESEGGNVNELLGKQEFNMFDEIQNYHSFTEMERWFRSIFNLLMEYLFSNVNTPKSNIINDVLKYVSSNYENPELSLKNTAEHFYINYAYLSQLFSREMSESFNHYLTRIRMEKAKKLVLESHVKLTDVALRCGYNNTSYFIKVFKRTTGMTPYKYRISLKERRQI